MSFTTLAALALSVPVATCEGDIARPIMVAHGPSARPWVFMADPERIEHIDGLPFSGFAYNIPMTWLAMSDEFGLFTEEQMHDQFGGLDFTFENLTENWVSLVVRRRGATPAEGDFFNDDAWADTVDQIRLLARVASTPKYQCVGIMFDNEQYFEQVWNYPDDVAHADEYSLEQYQSKARRRGREVMNAILEEWPACKVIVMHGPYRSAPEPRPFEVSMNQVGDASLYELDAPFFVGMAEVAGFKQVIDGGEVYQLRSRRDFAINTYWRRYEMGNSSVIPDDIGAVWHARVGVTHGLYNETWPTPDDVMNPELMQIALRQALGQGDPYTWIFTEGSETWLDPGGMPDDWRDAIQAGAETANIPACDADADADGIVGSGDLRIVLAGWGADGGFSEADRDLNGTVDANDLKVILRAWGQSPAYKY